MTIPSPAPALDTPLAGALRRYEAGLEVAVGALLRDAPGRVPALTRRLAAAGLDPADAGVADLARVPVLTKDELIDLQRQAPPFGGLLAPGADVRRLFCSPGPLYEPQLGGPDPWRWGEALGELGVARGDVLLNCFGYHLTPAGAMFEEGALALGATVVPGGVGNLDLQAALIGELGVTAYAGLPSYLHALLAKVDELGAAWTVDRALVTAEPLPPSLRAALQERVGVVRQAYGTAETGLLGYETADGPGLRLPDGVLVQVCDLDTGAPLDDGRAGQVVVTLLRPDYPLVRFGTGDLSAWLAEPDAAGRPRLAGVLGRVGAAVKVRGMFLHPRQAAAVVDGAPGVAAYRFVVDRRDHVDTLRCEIVPANGAGHRALAADVRARIRSGLRFDADVVVVDGLPAEPPGPLVDLRDWA